MNHLGDNTITDLVEAMLAPDRWADVEAHTASCDDCRRLVSELVRRTGPRGSVPPPPVGTRTLPPGTLVGRYVVREPLGSGAMGAVFAAFDPELDRAIALKLLHPGSAAQRERVQREARALGKLSHPNVVAAFDVGEHDGDLFLAMELVAGTNLRAWLAAPRTVDDILAVFDQAGRGLAAAHAAGLVHRDFKPDNVFVGDDGRVRIGDFGLAAGADGGTDLVGTPAYMAPEQLDGRGADPASDQFAFCVALHEALHGDRPFAINFAADVAAGPPRATSRSRAVPPHVTRVLERGLALAPATRFPTMSALLAALKPPRSRRAWWIALAVAGASAAAAALITRSLGAPPPPACADGADILAEVWSPIARAALAHDLTAARGPAAAPVIATTTAAIDDWTAGWAIGRRAACAAPPALQAARIACLDRGLTDLSAQLALWHTADTTTADAAVEAIGQLPAPAHCERAASAAWLPPLFAAQLAQAIALEHSGHSVEAQALLPPIAAAAEAGGDPSTLAMVLRARAEVERSLGKLTKAREDAARSARVAARAGDDHGMLAALIRQAQLATDQGHPLDAIDLCNLADALLERTGIDGADSVALLRGDALQLAGKPAEAVVELRRAISLIEGTGRKDQFERSKLAAAEVVLANALIAQHDLPHARELMLQSLALEEPMLGGMHPSIGRTLNDLANLEKDQGELAAAGEHYNRARAIFIAAYGPTHELVGMVDVSLGTFEVEQGHDAAARTVLDRARAELAAAGNANPIVFAELEQDVAQTLVDTDHAADALPYFAKAVADMAAGGEDGVPLANLLAASAIAELAAGQRAPAHAHVTAAIAELDKTTAEPADRVATWLAQAQLAWRDDDHTRAVALAQQIDTTVHDGADPQSLIVRAAARKSLAAWSKTVISGRP